MLSVLSALHGQPNLLQLHVGGNSLADTNGAQPSLALAGLLNTARKMEQLSLGGTGVALAAFESLPPHALKQMRALDLTGVQWGPQIVRLLAACGALTSVSLADGAASLAVMQRTPFLTQLFAHATHYASLDLDLSAGAEGTALLPELLPALAQGGCTSGLTMRASRLSDHLLILLLQQLAAVASSPAHAASRARLRSLTVDSNLPAILSYGQGAFDEGTSASFLEQDAATGGAVADAVSSAVLRSVASGQPPDSLAVGEALRGATGGGRGSLVQTLAVTVPAGVVAGQQLQLASPFGGHVIVAVPAGVVPGAVFHVQVNGGPGAQQLGGLLSAPPQDHVAFGYRLAVCEALGQLLRAAPSLQRLSVAGDYSPSGGALPRSPSLAFGPLLGVFFRASIASNRSLEFLDVSANGLGDAGIAALGQALRTNRTLTALRIDRNRAGASGLNTLKIALNGNKKVVDLPMPDDDIAEALRVQSHAYKQSLADELFARRVVKSAYRGRFCDEAIKQRGLDQLRGAKRAQAKAR
eukprot:3973120-Pleurochrysis_carterae.AAC.1